MKNQSKHNKAWMKKQIQKGLCVFCRDESLYKSSLCEKHYFKGRVRSVTGSYDNWEIIRDKFFESGEVCYYTGKKLVLGVNAGLDHLKPRSRFKHLKDSIDNLVWCDTKVNVAKRDLTNDEFIDVCKLVASRF